MTHAEATQYWMALSPEQKQTFYAYASKSGGETSAFEWFNHLVPDDIKDNPEHIEVFMDGGTVTHEVWVHDQGVANGHYEQVSYDIADKDLSRIQSGANGGEYTPDNTIMEDASVNRARGAEDMSPQELEVAETANAADTELIEFNDASFSAVESQADSVLDTVLDGVLPVTYGAKAAHYVWKATEGEEDRVAKTALAGGAVVATTYAACTFIPGVNIVLGGIAAWKLIQSAARQPQI